MDIKKKKKNCPYCLTMRCCLDHCCNWDECQCKDCILCGGVLENDYKPDEKKQLYAAFRAYDVLEDNKDLLQKPNSKINNAENVVENNLSIKKDEKNMKNEEISNEKNAENNKSNVTNIVEKEKTIENVTKIASNVRVDAKNAENESDRVRRLVDETTKKTNETLASIEKTLASLKKTQDECKATDQKFQDFQNKFQNVMDNFTFKLAEGLQSSGLLGPAHKNGLSAEKMYQPSISDVESVAESLIAKTNLVILTGAGISVASGIPTFRGKDESVKAQDFLTYKYFKEKPEEVWDWHYEFKRMVRLSSPNVCHTVVSEIQQFCEENDIECTLITQVFIIPSK